MPQISQISQIFFAAKKPALSEAERGVKGIKRGFDHEGTEEHEVFFYRIYRMIRIPEVEAGLRGAFYLMGVVEIFWKKGLQAKLGGVIIVVEIADGWVPRRRNRGII